jgi:hypothetical protein
LWAKNIVWMGEARTGYQFLLGKSLWRLSRRGKNIKTIFEGTVVIIFRGQQMLAQITSKTKFCIPDISFSRKAAPIRGVIFVLHQPSHHHHITHQTYKVLSLFPYVLMLKHVSVVLTKTLGPRPITVRHLWRNMKRERERILTKKWQFCHSSFFILHSSRTIRRVGLSSLDNMTWIQQS